MNQNFIILLFVVIIIGVVLYYNTNSKKERDPGGSFAPTFEVMGISISKTENYKPWFTETYTADEYIAMSQGAKFVYTFKINGGVDLLQNLSITRKRADGGSDQIEEVPESKWVEGDEIQVDFPVQTGENAKGEHEFSINYTTPDVNANGIMPYTINITDNLLSVKLENGGTEELEMVPVETSGINVAFSAEREEIYIYDSEEVVNFNAQGPVYMSPVAGTNGKGFKLEGVTGIPDTLYRVKYRGGYLLALSQNANFTDTEYLTTDKSKKKFKEGELINKLFYITTNADSVGNAKNFFLDLAENEGSSGSTISNVVGEEIFSTPGTYNWVAPTGVTSVCVVCVGGGGASGKGGNYMGSGGAGGGLAYKNNITVVPGTSYDVIVGAGGAGFNGEAVPGTRSSSNGGTSTFRWGSSGECSASGGQHGGGARDAHGLPIGGSPSGTYDGGGNGGTCEGNYSMTGWPNYYLLSSGGGGAGGYSGAGGNGAGSRERAGTLIDATAGAGGGGGGGGARRVNATGASYGGASGGGVGLYGEKSNGAAGGTDVTTEGHEQVAANIAGGGGSGGEMGNLSPSAGTQAKGFVDGGIGGSGGLYGGGAGSCHGQPTVEPGGDGGNGAVRIIWGSGRSFPSNAD